MIRHITRTKTTDALGRLFINESLSVPEMRIKNGVVLKSIDINICPINSGVIVNAGFPVIQVEFSRFLTNTDNNPLFELNQNKGYKVILDAYISDGLIFSLAAIMFQFDGSNLATPVDVLVTYTLNFDLAQRLR